MALLVAGSNVWTLALPPPRWGAGWQHRDGPQGAPGSVDSCWVSKTFEHSRHLCVTRSVALNLELGDPSAAPGNRYPASRTVHGANHRAVSRGIARIGVAV